MENIICPICCFTFDNKEKKPLVLPCGHTFCNACLKSIKQRQCPLDNSIYNFSTLPLNFTLSSLIENTGFLETITQYNNFYCKVHNKKIEFFCEIENLFICSKCFLENHKNHVDSIKIFDDEVLTKKIEENVNLLKDLKDDIDLMVAQGMSLLEKKSCKSNENINDFLHNCQEFHKLIKKDINQFKDNKKNSIIKKEIFEVKKPINLNSYVFQQKDSRILK